MARKRTPDIEYRAKLKEIQKFVDYSLNPKTPLTKAQKRLITIYYTTIEEERLHSAVLYKGARKNVREVAKIVGSKIPRKRLKVVPVPTRMKGAKASLKTIKRGRKRERVIVVKPQRIKGQKPSIVRELFVYLNPKKLALDPDAEITKKLSNKKFISGQFQVFFNFCNQAFTDVETAIDVWRYYYMQAYPIGDPRCCRGCVLYNVSKYSYERVEIKRKRKRRAKKKK